MSETKPGERLFRAWSEATTSFDEDAGRARFLESAARGTSRAPSRTRRGYFLIAAAMLIGVVALMLWRSPTSLRFSTSAGEGQIGAWLATDATREMPLTFSEGTRLVILPDSRGRVEQLDPTRASFLLERGEVHARVVHRAGTEWRFLAGPFEVQVTGTVLDVKWDPAGERFSVRVDEGSVVVHGPELGASQVVRAGERCVVDLPSRTMHLPSALDLGSQEDAGIDPSTEAPATSSSAKSATRVQLAPTPWTTFAERGDYDGAYAAATSAGLASLYRASSSDELLRLAQVAQLSGHRATERESLLACRQRFSGTEQSAVAAYELGRASSPSEAASWFETYLREEPAGPLAREALGRLVEAHADEGNDSAARSAATRYLARYPDGPQATLARRVLSGARE